MQQEEHQEYVETSCQIFAEILKYNVLHSVHFVMDKDATNFEIIGKWIETVPLRYHTDTEVMLTYFFENEKVDQIEVVVREGDFFVGKHVTDLTNPVITVVEDLVDVLHVAMSQAAPPKMFSYEYEVLDMN